jgi:hypothetical protein
MQGRTIQSCSAERLTTSDRPTFTSESRSGGVHVALQQRNCEIIYIYSPLAPTHHSLTDIDKPRHSPAKLVFYVRLCQTMPRQQSSTWGVLALLFAAAVSTTALSPFPPNRKVSRV